MRKGIMSNLNGGIRKKHGILQRVDPEFPLLGKKLGLGTSVRSITENLVINWKYGAYSKEKLRKLKKNQEELLYGTKKK